MDKWALVATPTDEKSLDSLSRYLVKGCKSDKQKARAIYGWITDRIAYDVDWFLDSQRFPLVQEPEGVLKKRKTDCVGYSNLFVALATRMKVKAERIDGYYKLPEHKPGDKVTLTHSWIGFQVGEKRFLVDPTNGAGGIDGQKVRKQFSGYYFCLDPEQWILCYFPKARIWQLVEQPISLEQFEAWPGIDQHLFRVGASGKVVRDALKKKMEFVKVYWLRGDGTRLMEAPLERSLQAERDYKFVIRSTDFEQIAVIAADGKWQALGKEETVFSGKVAPSKGPLRLAGKPVGEKTWQVFLDYLVN